MYLKLNNQDFLPACRETSIQNLIIKVRRGKYVRVVRKSNRIVAWIYADLVQLEHTDYTCFQQLYYASDATGFPAARYLRMLHADMIRQAYATNAQYCISIASHIDTGCVLTRLLEKDGWARKGHVAVFPLKTAPAGTQIVPGCDPRPRLGSPSGGSGAEPPTGR